ncbi:23S rRNA (uracil(1939)-C(5))-methyltransferase RlmD [Saltatorellus ferox]|uniref:23S rRNA (uracil(1939)-C(5))-methyltransferase RlmD n=1 Tax=Saltatorellus ferox TaxID=2528018 RepID=UPI003AF3DDE6
MESPVESKGGSTWEERRPHKNELVDVLIERIDDRGRGVGPVPKAKLTVRFANPGATIQARVLGRSKKRLDGRIEQILDPGPHASPARCPHAGVCGGCALPTLDYAEQLRQKRLLVEDAVVRAFEARGVALTAEVGDVVPAPRLEGYRNKMDFTFGSKRYILEHEPQGVDASFGLGLHAPGLYQKVLDVEHCAIAFEGASEIVRAARELAIERGLSPWDLKSHTGLLRHLVLRRGERTGETMINLVTSERAAAQIDAYVATLIERFPGVTTVVQNLTTREATVAYGEEQHVLMGPGTISDIISGKRFLISADSFFQTNTAQAERLFEIVRERAALEARDTLFDVYCGAGTIGLVIGEDAGAIVGFESAPTAVRDARLNAERNGVANATYHEGDVLATMREALDERSVRPDVLVVDPPRAGLHPKVPAQLIDLGSPRVVYVSCNPKTGAQDVAAFVEAGYELQSVEPVDLFPHTPHVEAVFSLRRSGGRR